ncbi:polysaccharide deacetylase [Enterococcus faecium]|nr:polysaccharide deacetylase [Enterococcus faecium]
MSDKNTYACRSQRHKQESDTYENPDQLNETVTSKTANENKQSRIPKKNSNYSKYIFALFTALILVTVATAGYIFYKLKQQEAEAKAKYETAAKNLMASIQEEQDQSRISTKIDTISDGENKCLVYRPVDESAVPFKNANQLLDELAQKQQKKHCEKEVLTVARIKATAISSKVGQYSIEADSFIWDRSKEHFKNPDNISEKAIYVSEKTGKEITNKDLIPDEGSLLGIQQVIQQSILDHAEKPEKIIDAVLTMDRISYDSKMTYTPDELTIILPNNSIGTSKVTLNYKDIAPFIDTDLVSQESIKDALPALDENKKYVALTFDDGPNNSSTLDLLNILKTDNVKATFFMLGQMVDQNPDVAKQAHDEGHEVACHSYSHPQLNALSTDELRSEINEANKAIFKATGVLPRNIRPPYGAIDKKSAETIGMPIIQWDIDSQDWKSKNPRTINNVVKQNVYSGAIILIHDIHPESVKAIPNMISMLKNEGYEFVTIDQLLSGKQKTLHQYFGMNDERLVD